MIDDDHNGNVDQSESDEVNLFILQKIDILIERNLCLKKIGITLSLMQKFLSNIVNRKEGFRKILKNIVIGGKTYDYLID